jgi:hypothetical protein
MKTILFSLLYAIAGSIPGLAQTGAGTNNPFVLSVTLKGTTSCTFTPTEVGYGVSKAPPPPVLVISGVIFTGVLDGVITIVKPLDSCSGWIAKTLFAGQTITGVITLSKPGLPVPTALETLKLYSANIQSVSVDWPGSKATETLVLHQIQLNITGM